MAEAYDSNGEYPNYAEEDGEKSDKQELDLTADPINDPKLSFKAIDYIREMQAEKINMDPAKFPIATRLVNQEITKVYETGRPSPKEYRYVDIYREKPLKVTAKVLIPVKEHPKFNFVGKLLGPKGNSMKRLQEETMCKMAVLGRGSMKDRAKEEELRQSMDPKYAHLCDELHVEICALGPPAEAHARVAFALAEIRKYLIPDYNDNIRQEQLRELELNLDDVGRNREQFKRSILKTIPRAAMLPMRATTPTITGRAVMPAKTKIMSILDRARAAMEASYEYEDEAYDPAFVTAPSPTPKSRNATYAYDLDTSYFRNSRGSFEPKASTSQHWIKAPKTSAGPRYHNEGRYRVSPYRRPAK